MSTVVRRIRIFLASPGDVSAERNQVATVIGELDRTIAGPNDVALELVRWETHATPDMGTRPQEIINRQIGAYDVFVGIMWRRFGTATGTEESGTEEEFRRACSAYADGTCHALLFYFCEAEGPSAVSPDEVEQFRRVKEFRAGLEGNGLVWTYTDRDRFADVVRPHLTRVLLNLVRRTGQPMLEGGLSRALEQSKQEMEARALPYHTPALMLALLSAPERFFARCLDRLETGLAARVKRQLDTYIEATLAEQDGAGFRDFDWNGHELVRRASDLAHDEGAEIVNEKHLVRVLLESSSKTVAEFRIVLGARLPAFVELVRHAPARAVDEGGPTPGTVFGREG